MKEDNFDKYLKWVNEMMEKYGWYCNWVIDEKKTPNNINFHTHGLPESFGHANLQICLPISTDMAQQIFNDIVAEIEKGNQFKPDIPYAGLVAAPYTLKFIPARRNGEKVLRVLIPDENNTLKAKPYASQITKLTDGVPLRALHYDAEDITNTKQVLAFMKTVISEHDLNFHPDTPFGSYINYQSRQPVFTEQAARRLDKVMEKCFEVCGKDTDLYELAIKAFNAFRRQLDKEDPNISKRKGI